MRFSIALLSTAAALQATSPYPRGVYDPSSAASYYRSRPLEVLGRGASLVSQSAGFGLSLLGDFVAGDLDKRADERAAELVELLTALGPTFIKAGQSASIRTDLLPAAYIRGLTALQDQVPPFSSEEARQIIREELGVDASKAFASLSNEPVAAASLGQVYRGTLPNGTAVAVKVQRPNMEERIALDMHLIRDYAAPIAKLIGVPGDLVGTADAWGAGFVDELNYVDEADNARQFNKDVSRSSLAGRVFAPPVIESCSKRRVLTTEWIVGERLDRSSVPEDVPRLCSVAMNIYLEMMLDTGILHCDPHPGNLLRTPDGMLCILDWGLVTSVRNDLQLTLIEHVAHLTASDYGKVPSDLVKLGFVPEGAERVVIDNGVVDFLTFTYSTWKSGGGAAKLDVPALFSQVRELAADTPGGIFQVPPYFAYIAKSFSVLEGIGLSVDPNYSIVDETLPYISKRILTDPSPRTAGALESFLFGDAKEDLDGRVLNAGRVATLVDGAKRYAASTTTSAAAANAAANSGAAQSLLQAAGGALSVDNAGSGSGITVSQSGLDLEAAVDTIVDLLLAREASPIQTIAIEQLALLTGAAGRARWADLRKQSGSPGLEPLSDRSRLGALVDPLGLFRNSPLVENDERDMEALAAAAKLAELANELLPSGGGSSSSASGGGGGEEETPLLAPEELQQFNTLLLRKTWERREDLQLVARRFTAKLLDQTAQRVLNSKR